MKFRRVVRYAIALLGCVLIVSPSRGEVVIGSFSGVVTNNTNGMDQNGFFLSTLIGQTITGGFSFDTADIHPNGGGSNYKAYQSTIPVTIFQDVGSHHYEFVGASSDIYLSDNWPGAYSYLFQLVVSGPSGAPLPNAVISAQSNTPLFSNVLNPLTLHVDANSFQTGTGQDQFGLANSFTGMLTYSVTSMGVAPVPEPETYAMLLAGLGMLGFVARRRKQNL